MSDTTAHSRRIALFGSTGSIGVQTLEVIRHHPAHFSVAVLAAGSKLDLLLRQVEEFRPAVAVIARPAPETDLANLERGLRANGIATELRSGNAALEEAAREADYDTLMAAITGARGLPSTLAAARRGKRIALANKESLVMTGPLLMALSRPAPFMTGAATMPRREEKKHGAADASKPLAGAVAPARGAEIIPVDSEHSALWQCLCGEDLTHVRRVVLTASGGPFRTTPLEELRRVTAAQALKHPTWTMGPKITIDSATLMNKALEIIEARWLFGLERGRLHAVIHPQSVIHSMVEFIDGSILAQLGEPDMRVPIQLALSWPQRLDGPARRTDFARPLSLDFEPIDEERFPAIRLGYEVAERGGTAGAVFSAANEIAVSRFLSGAIGYAEIYNIVERVTESHRLTAVPTLDDVLEADAWARREAAK